MQHFIIELKLFVFFNEKHTNIKGIVHFKWRLDASYILYATMQLQ